MPVEYASDRDERAGRGQASRWPSCKDKRLAELIGRHHEGGCEDRFKPDHQPGPPKARHALVLSVSQLSSFGNSDFRTAASAGSSASSASKKFCRLASNDLASSMSKAGVGMVYPGQTILATGIYICNY